tara:strand:+ start:171 stop:755 length:585 start_codon:yes stop_codon:yes gene_type:complete
MSRKELNIYVLGSGGVGKSALTLRFMSDRFEDDYEPTIEDSFRKQIIVDDKYEIINVVDTAGQEEYKSLQSGWIEKGDGFIIVYSIIDENTFYEVEELVDSISRMRENLNIPIIIVGNKVDLQNERKVSYQKGKKLGETFEVPFFETSAKEKINDYEIFFQIVREINKYRSKERRRESISKRKPKKNKKCCIIS